ncbi:GTP-binding protein [Bradyrhizobium pachyrhizi]|uniref:GTP-binding protein n=1 Tax=Bradyrhizobium pachyrhizi TaxID=280333 RepID=A0A844SUF9_9BRAD|nr:Rab family GTPase [Bradyrhizobium pachyrhizi]MVT66010.1 GTP-binding protein [Bradyrhizobium pachyrhizi]WFU56657.1 GTP-binding protein [Bradyrhizobium pachyrhizi]
MLTAKVMLLGDMGVGKTSILYRLIYNRFEGQYKSTLGVEILSHDVAPADGGDPMRLVLWDTDGDFGTQIFDTVYVTGASAAIIVSDVTRPQTVTRMVELVRGFEERFPGRPYRALLNKIDLPEAAGSAGAIAGLAKSSIKSVSAKTGVGIAESFVELAQTIRRRQL